MNRLWWEDKIIALKCSNFQFGNDDIGMYSIGRRKINILPIVDIYYVW